MKPIIFDTDSVRAILDGRKTRFSIPIKPQPTYWDEGECVYEKDRIVGPEMYSPARIDKNGELYPGEEVYGIYSDDGEYGCIAPYKPGDVLWVRETWSTIGEWTTVDPGWMLFDGYIYKADWDIDEHPKWHPSILMPRSAARLFLLVTDVRAQRVQDITEADAIAEGFAGVICNHPGRYACEDCMNTGWLEPPQVDFMFEWNKRYAKRGHGWDKNDWVFAHTFERIEKPEGV
jgi:hypothetical protein